MSKLAEAARNNDAMAEEHGLQHVLRTLGLDSEEVQHVADQRAVRAVLVRSRGPEALKALDPARPTVVSPPFSPMEREMHLFFTAMYLDGIALGWRAGRDDS